MTISLMKEYLKVNGKDIKLSPGMSITAEIKTGTRRVIEFLISPIKKVINESARER